LSDEVNVVGQTGEAAVAAQLAAAATVGFIRPPFTASGPLKAFSTPSVISASPVAVSESPPSFSTPSAVVNFWTSLILLFSHRSNFAPPTPTLNDVILYFGKSRSAARWR
jgi:hypothetical protein